MNTPCKDCVDREVGCHSKCEKYIAYRESREQIYQQRLKDKEYADFRRDEGKRVAKILKSRPGSR